MLTMSQALALAVRHHRAGELEPAERLYRAALRLDPLHAGVHYNLGSVLQKYNRLDEAVECYRQAVKLDPSDSTTHRALGTALKARGDLAGAIASFQAALALRPEYAEAHNNLGNTLLERGDTAAAVESYRRAAQHCPELAGFQFNLGNALRHAGRLEEAESSFRRALEMDPRDPEGHNSLGIALFDQGRVMEAVACYDSAIRMDPDHARGHYNRALAWLVLGEWEQGWPEYEWRWKNRDLHDPPCSRPRWTGQELRDKTLLIEAEQGLGDTIQFIRFAALARRRVNRVVCRCQRPLLQLLEGVSGIDEIFADDDPPTHCDVWSPLLSLPMALGTKLSNIPSEPYLKAHPLLVERWRKELERVQGFRIGIQWQGNPAYPKDRFRSFPLRQFGVLAHLPGVSLVSLQKGAGAEQLRNVDFPVFELGSRLDETSGAFCDTAAVMRSLDLVITTDTSIGHLAGALGVPAWIPLTTVPEWRWLWGREDSPWYPTVRLFRQARRDAWDEVFGRMRACLQDGVLCASHGKQREAG